MEFRKQFQLKFLYESELPVANLNKSIPSFLWDFRKFQQDILYIRRWNGPPFVIFIVRYGIIYISKGI